MFLYGGCSRGRLIFYDLSQTAQGREKIRSALETAHWAEKQGDIYSLCIDVVERIFPIGLNRYCAVFYIGSKLTKPKDDDAKHDRVNKAFQKMIQGTFKSNVDKYQAKVNRGIESALNFDFLEECGSDEEPVAIYQAREPQTTPRGLADELASVLAATTKKREVLPVQEIETPVDEESEAPPVQEREIPPVQERETPVVEEQTLPTPQEELSEPPAKKKTRKSLFQRMFSPIGKWLSSLFNWFKYQISKIFGHKNS